MMLRTGDVNDATLISPQARRRPVGDVCQILALSAPIGRFEPKSIGATTQRHILLRLELCDTISFVMVTFDRTLRICPSCGGELRLFESFPARSGLPEVDVFTCDLCEKMILQDPTPSSATAAPKTPS
jgi:hypothetical protein